MNTHMNRYLKVAALLALALGAVALTGCASDKAADESTEMKTPKVWGYVTGEKFAKLDVADQPGVDTLVVKRALAPSDAWIVVHLDDNGMPGERVGFTHISMGENLDVEVPLKGVTSENVIVAVHADKGMPGELEFDMMNKMQSPDRPFFVNEKELAKVVVVGASGISPESLGAMEASDQPGVTGEPSMAETTAPDVSAETAPADDSSMDQPTTSDSSKDQPTTGDSSMSNDSSNDSAMSDDSSQDMGESSDEDEGMAGSSTTKSPAWGLLGGFAVLNAIIIAFAAGFKRGSAKAKSEGS